MYKTKNKFYFQHLSDGRLVSVTVKLRYTGLTYKNTIVYMSYSQISMLEMSHLQNSNARQVSLTI